MAKIRTVGKVRTKKSVEPTGDDISKVEMSEPLGPDVPLDPVDGKDVYLVKLPNNGARKFYAYGEDHAITLYNRHFGIQATEHEYQVDNLTEMGEKKAKEVEKVEDKDSKTKDDSDSEGD